MVTTAPLTSAGFSAWRPNRVTLWKVTPLSSHCWVSRLSCRKFSATLNDARGLPSLPYLICGSAVRRPSKAICAKVFLLCVLGVMRGWSGSGGPRPAKICAVSDAIAGRCVLSDSSHGGGAHLVCCAALGLFCVQLDKEREDRFSHVSSPVFRWVRLAGLLAARRDRHRSGRGAGSSPGIGRASARRPGSGGSRE